MTLGAGDGAPPPLTLSGRSAGCSWAKAAFGLREIASAAPRPPRLGLLPARAGDA
jgi:hypothetical protein